jgi:hypothetical protein
VCGKNYSKEELKKILGYYSPQKKQCLDWLVRLKSLVFMAPSKTRQTKASDTSVD